ncbi:MAG: PAS domain S-box protein [Promethearchaeota archaeon]|nr:MAG: PAS domain S-box protein [Candidatus Lokiarchaeota archaeon]
MKKKKSRDNLEEEVLDIPSSSTIDIIRIYDSVPIPTAIYNDLDKSVTFNKKFTETFGFTADDIKIVDDWWNLCIPIEDIRESLKTEWNKRFKESQKNNTNFDPMEIEVHCKTGSKKYIKYNLEVIEHFYVGFFVDITELKDAMEQKLHVSERQTNSLLYAPNTVPMVIFNRDGKILEINDAAIRETKISADKLIGKNADSLLEEYGIENIYKFEDVVKNKKSVNFQVEFLHNMYDVEYYPLLNEDEEIDKVALYARNISELYLKERLATSEIKFKSFMEHGPFLAYIKDKNGKYIYGNPPVHEFIKNYGDKDFIGSEVGTFFNQKTAEEMRAYDKEILKEKHPIFIPPHPHTDKDGRTSWMKEIKFPISISGEETYIGGIVLFVTEEVDLREKFEESERKARILLNAPTDPIALLDRNGKIIDLNAGCATALRLPLKDAIGKNILDLFPNGFNPEHAANRTSIFEKIIKEKTTLEFVGSYPHLVLQFRMFPIFDSDEEVQWIALFINDITKLKENERKYHLTQFSVDNSSIPILIFASKGLVTYANKAACDYLGYTKDEILQLDAWEFCEELKSDSFFNKTKELLKSKGRAQLESILIRKNGTSFPANITVNIFELNNEFHNVVYLEDISLQKRNEMELNKLFNATEQSPISIVITDTNGVIEYVNPKFCDITGYRHEELIGRNPRVLKSGYTTQKEYSQMWDLINRGEIWKGMFRNVKKNGEFFWENATISPIFNSEGNITHYLGLKEDITEKITLQEQLQHSQKMEAMGRLAGGISHDFNNILTVIMGTAQLLQHDMIDESTRDSLSEIIKASNRAAGLTRQLLAFSKKQLLKPSMVNLNNVLQEMENMVRRILPENIQLDIKLHNQPITIKVDKIQLEQVILNLVINAKEAMLDGGVLKITSFVESQHLGSQLKYFGSFSIADSGVGMDEQTKRRLFEPFFTTKAKGTGLGLATVYGIIAQSKGEIRVESELGQGSKFFIHFPLKLNAVSEEIEPVIKRSDWKGSECLLLIEDEEAVRKIIYQILSNEGYTVWQAENGQSAILNYSHLLDKIDLIITDVIMPIMGGVEVVSKFLEIDPKMKVLYISGYAGDENTVKDQEAFITKPIERIQLLKKIREILG